MYGYAPFAPAAGVRSPYTMQPYSYTLMGAEPAAAPTLGESVSNFLDKPTLESYPSVKNKYVIAAALVAGLGYWGYRAGWFS